MPRLLLTREPARTPTIITLPSSYMWSLRFTIKSLLVGFALSLIAAAQETPWRYAVKPGDSRDQVIQTYGEPKSVAHTGNREILLYPEGRVVLRTVVGTSKFVTSLFRLVSVRTWVLAAGG